MSVGSIGLHKVNRSITVCGSPGGVGRVAAEPFPLEAGSGLAGMAQLASFTSEA